MARTEKKKYVFTAKFELIGESEETARNALVYELELMLNHADEYTPSIEYRGLELIDVKV